VDTAVVITIATILVAAIAFLVLGLFRRQADPPKRTDRWAAQTTLAEMRKEGAGLPAEVGEEANRSEGPPGAEPPRTPIQGSRPPSGAD
jgi:hypothetical protein